MSGTSSEGAGPPLSAIGRRFDEDVGLASVEARIDVDGEKDRPRCSFDVTQLRLRARQGAFVACEDGELVKTGVTRMTSDGGESKALTFGRMNDQDIVRHLVW